MTPSSENRFPLSAPASSQRIATNLRLLMGMHDLRQRELAVLLGVTPQALWNIVNGRSVPRPRTLERAADLFAVEVRDFHSDPGTCARAGAAAFERASVRSGLQSMNGRSS
ncbi:MAG: helix-turn-helix domain-containing protein [Gaiellales bacterium]